MSDAFDSELFRTARRPKNEIRVGEDYENNNSSKPKVSKPNQNITESDEFKAMFGNAFDGELKREVPPVRRYTIADVTITPEILPSNNAAMHNSQNRRQEQTKPEHDSGSH